MSNKEEGFVCEGAQEIRLPSDEELMRVAEVQMADLWQIVGDIEKHLFRVKMNLCFYSVEAAQMAMHDLRVMLDEQV